MADVKSTMNIEDTLQTTITNYDDKTAQFRVLWTINDYEVIQNTVKHKEYIETTKSFSPFDNGARYRLRLYPKGCSQSSGNHASLFVEPFDSDKVKTWMYFSFAIIDKMGALKHGKYTISSNEVASAGKGWANYFTTDTSSELLSNNSLQIIFDGTMWSEEPQFNEEKEVYNCMEKGSSVMADPQFFYNYSHMPHDAKVTVGNGQHHFSVSQSFLSSRSAVFHQKFSDVSDNNIKIPNVRAEVLRFVLYFLCTNSVMSTISTMLPEVIKFASEFELYYLMEICQIKMIQNLGESNALDYFRIANEIKAEKLKNKCLDFIVANGSSISQQPSFQQFKAQYSELGPLLERLMIGNRSVVNF